MLNYALKDLFRNRRRTAAAAAGVALAVGLVSGIAFFVDGSSSQMTARALAPVAVDMQAAVKNPLASAISLSESLLPAAPLNVGQVVTVSLVAANPSVSPANGVVIKDSPVSQLAYVAGSTKVAGSAVPDVVVPGETVAQSPLGTGVSVGTIAAGGTSTVTYQARVVSLVAPGALALGGSLSSTESATPTQANAAPGLDLARIALQVRSLSGVKAVEPVAVVDLPPGALRNGTTAHTQPLKLLAISPSYARLFPRIGLGGAVIDPGSALATRATADLVGAAPGQSLQLILPGRALPVTLRLAGVADLSRATPLFASRNPDNQGEVVASPNVLVVDFAFFQGTVLPALRADAGAQAPVVRTAPIVELDVALDRTALSGDPTAAVVRTRALRRTIERLAPGDLTVVDNLSDTLTAAQKDTTLAKVLFIFLGLPGVLLAAYLSRYAGGLLAESQRRERAMLRARGIRPGQLMRALGYNAIAIAVLGSLAGLALGAAAVVLLFGRDSLAVASPGALVTSVSTSVAAGLLTTLLALYLPARRSLGKEVGEERRELASQVAPAWLRMRLDSVFLAAAAVVGGVTYLTGGYKPTPVEGQSVSLSFYVLLAPLFFWIGATLLMVRLLLLGLRRLPASGPRHPQPARRLGLRILWAGISRRPYAMASGVVALSLAIAFGVSLGIFTSTYQAEKLADARFVVGGDVRVTPAPGAVGAPANSTPLLDQLKGPGVTAITPVSQTSSAIVGTDKRALLAIQPRTFSSVADFKPGFLLGITPDAAMNALAADPNATLVDVELARTFNVQVGDAVRIQLPDRLTGKPTPLTLHAVGLFKNFPGMPQGVDLVTSMGTYQNVTHATAPDFYLLRTGGTDAANAAVVTALSSGPGKAAQLTIDTTARTFNLDQSSLAALNLNGLGRLESAYTVMMSALGIAIFVFGLLLQRRKEHVTMRALGMRMRQLQTLVLGEAGAVTGLSLVIGTGVGVGMSVMFVQILTPLFTVPPQGLTVPFGPLGLLALLVTAATGLSSLVAGVVLRRTALVELLREE
ncbi:MAG: FtsX-like permease family protein [Candidatus Dormibacteraeota bacterium]|nr:FtsX-like permease family protein [Candidatus Dormibacteraeota bacterium]